MKRISTIITVAMCGVISVFALTGCDALGLQVTEHGIEGNSNTLLMLTLIGIVVIVLIQRLTSR